MEDKDIKMTDGNNAAGEELQEFDIEASFERIEEIISLLSDKDTGLKKSMELYSEGVLLAAKCKENLEGVEKEIQVLKAGIIQ